MHHKTLIRFVLQQSRETIRFLLGIDSIRDGIGDCALAFLVISHSSAIHPFSTLLAHFLHVAMSQKYERKSVILLLRTHHARAANTIISLGPLFLPLFEGPFQLDLRLLQNTDRAALLLIPFFPTKKIS